MTASFASLILLFLDDVLFMNLGDGPLLVDVIMSEDPKWMGLDMCCSNLLPVIVFNRAVGVDGAEEDAFMNVFFSSLLSTDRKGEISSDRATLTKKSLEPDEVALPLLPPLLLVIALQLLKSCEVGVMIREELTLLCDC